AAAAADLEEGEGAGDGGVEALDLAGHGDVDEGVAGVADEAVEAGAFAADDDADGLVGEVEGEEAGLGGAVEADAPDAGGAELLDGAGEVGDLGHGEVLESAGGGLDGAPGQGGARGARAPRLCGASTPSRARKKGGSRPARGTARSSVRSIGWMGATMARTPWWAPLRASASIREGGAGWTSVPRWRARSRR